MALEAEGVEVHTGTAAVGVARDGDGVVVRVRQGSVAGNPRVYAAGDVTDGPGCVYVAAAGGRAAAGNALKALHATGTASDDPRELDLSAVPSVTFTAPQVASVGLPEAAAQAAGYHVDVVALNMADVPRARS